MTVTVFTKKGVNKMKKNNLKIVVSGALLNELQVFSLKNNISLSVAVKQLLYYALTKNVKANKE